MLRAMYERACLDLMLNDPGAKRSALRWFEKGPVPPKKNKRYNFSSLNTHIPYWYVVEALDISDACVEKIQILIQNIRQGRKPQLSLV